MSVQPDIKPLTHGICYAGITSTETVPQKDKFAKSTEKFQSLSATTSAYPSSTKFAKSNTITKPADEYTKPAETINKCSSMSITKPASSLDKQPMADATRTELHKRQRLINKGEV